LSHLTAQDQWTFGANDPDFFGWLTFAAYFLAAAVCYVCGRRLKAAETDPADGRRRAFWRITTLVLVLLGINKQLDLQTPFLTGARHLAHTEGWYSIRRGVQWLFIGGLAATGLALVAWSMWKLRRARFEYRLTCAGLILLLAYVVMRASPVEYVNRVLGWDVAGIRGKRHILELAGISCVGLGASVELIRRRESGGRPAAAS
jgi:hypothetical protein